MNPWNAITSLTGRDGSARATGAALAAAVLVPLLALAICLGAFWAPDDHTQGLPVALVNLDQGDTRNGNTTNAGDDLVKQVTKDAALRWKTTDAADAAKGVDDGTYAFAVTIPADFSRRIADASSLDSIARSVAATDGNTSDALAAATIAIRYDDANNAQTRALGDRAMEAIRKALSQSAGQTTASTLLITISQLDQGLGSAADGAKALGEGATQLQHGTEQLGDGLGQLATGADGLATGSQTLATALGGLNGQMPTLSAALGQLAAGASGVAAGNQAIAGQVGQLAEQANQYRDQAVAQIDAITGQLDCASGGPDAGMVQQAIAQILAQTQRQDGQTAAAGTGDTDGTRTSSAQAAGQTGGQSANETIESPHQPTDGNANGDAAATGADTATATQDDAGRKPTSNTDGTNGMAGSGLASDSSGANANDTATNTANGTNAPAANTSRGDGADDATTGTGPAATTTDTAAVMSGITRICATLTQSRAQLAAIPDLTQSEQVRQINALAQGAQAVADGMGELNRQSSQLTDGIGALAQGAQTLGDGAQTLAQGTHAASDGTDALTKGAQTLTDGIGTLGDGLRKGADAVPTLSIGGGSDGANGNTGANGGGGTNSGKTDTSAAMRQLDAFNALRNTTAVMTDPVRNAATTGNEATTLGMALAPMLIACALALGAMLAYGMMRAMPRRALAGTLPGWRAVAGGYVPVLAIGVVEALAMLAVLVWAMGARAVNMVALVVAAALAAAMFAALQQLLVLAWGRRLGLVAALALHVLGFVACGGLYPQAVMPMALRVVAPLMPATHAVDAMRVALTGGAPATLLGALGIMLAATLACLGVSAWVAGRRVTWTVARLHAVA